MRNILSAIAKWITKKTESSEFGSGEDTDQLIKSLEEHEKSRCIIFRKLLKKISRVDRQNKRLIELVKELRDLLSGGKEKEASKILEFLNKFSKEDLEKIAIPIKAYNLNEIKKQAADENLEVAKPELQKDIDDFLKQAKEDASNDIKREFLKTLINLTPEEEKELRSLTTAIQLTAILSDADELNQKQRAEKYEKQMYREIFLKEVTEADIKNQWKRINELEIRILHNKGIMLLGLEKYESAYKCFDTITTINPELKKVWLNKGIAAWGMRNYKEEINCYDQASEKNPNYALAYYNKGILFKEVGKHEAAEQLFKKAYDLDPKLREHKGVFH